MDDTDDWRAVYTERDGDAEHGKEVCIVNCAIEGIDYPGWGIGDEVLLGAAFAVAFFTDEPDDMSASHGKV